MVNWYASYQLKPKSYIQTINYPTISHKVNSIYQIESLIRYSNLHGGIPLHLLYNYYAATPTLTMYG